VSALPRLYIFRPFCMNNAGFSQRLTRPIAGFTLLAFMTIAAPPPSVAQKPVLQRTIPQSLKISLAQSEAAYTLGAGDRIRLDIFSIPEYSGEYQVLVDGTLNLPIIGSISVQGLTLQSASNLISSRYARYVRRPIITLSLLTPRPVKIAVSGEVNRAGSYTVPVAEGRQFPTVTQAIQLAGGTTQSANVRRVQVRRRQGGQRQVLNIDLVEVLQNGNVEQDVSLRDGDTVFIPTAAAGANRDLTASNLSPQTVGPLKVAVVGEVSRPGTHIVKSEGNTSSPPTVTQAIQIAGGMTASANTRQIQIRRPTKTGSPQLISINLLQFLQAGDSTQDIPLQEGDTIFIPTRTDINPAESRIIAASTLATQATEPIKIAVVGQVGRPGTYTVNGGAGGGGGANRTSGPPTLTQAIQVAGGIKPSADIRQIQVRRFTRLGSEQVIDVNLWQLLQAGDLSQDVALQEGDTVSVPTATSLDPAEASALAEASFSPNTIRVNVVGEVTKAGAVEVPPNTPLNQALLAAGGFNNRARKRSVELVRLNPNGTVTKRDVDVDLSQGINDKTNPPLRNNDVIVVRRSGLASFSDTLSTVLSPIGGVFTFLRLFGL